MHVHGAAYLWGFREIWGLSNNRKDHEVAVAHRSFDGCACQAGPSQKTGQRHKAWGLPPTGEGKREFPGGAGSESEIVLVCLSEVSQHHLGVSGSWSSREQHQFRHFIVPGLSYLWLADVGCNFTVTL